MSKLYTDFDYDVEAKPTLMEGLWGIGNVLLNLIFENIVTKPNLRIEMDIRHVKNEAGNQGEILMDGWYGRPVEEGLRKVEDYVVLCQKAYDSSRGTYINTDDIYVINFSTYCNTDTIQVRKDIKGWIRQRFLDSPDYVCITNPKEYPGIYETLHAWDY